MSCMCGRVAAATSSSPRRRPSTGAEVSNKGELVSLVLSQFPRELRDGEVGKCRGVVGLEHHKGLASPLSASRCVYYETVVEELRRRGASATTTSSSTKKEWCEVAREKKGVDFFVDDVQVLVSSGNGAYVRATKCVTENTYDQPEASPRLVRFLERHGLQKWFFAKPRVVRAREAVIAVGSKGVSALGVVACAGNKITLSPVSLADADDKLFTWTPEHRDAWRQLTKTRSCILVSDDDDQEGDVVPHEEGNKPVEEEVSTLTTLSLTFSSSAQPKAYRPVSREVVEERNFPPSAREREQQREQGKTTTETPPMVRPRSTVIHKSVKRHDCHSFRAEPKQVVTVTVPKDAAPWASTFVTLTDGRCVQVKVPPGYKAGDTMEIQI